MPLVAASPAPTMSTGPVTGTPGTSCGDCTGSVTRIPCSPIVQKTGREVLLASFGLERDRGLVRLHATGGYCTVRHALIPAMLLWLAAAHGLAWIIRSCVIEGHWLLTLLDQVSIQHIDHFQK